MSLSRPTGAIAATAGLSMLFLVIESPSVEKNSTEHAAVVSDDGTAAPPDSMVWIEGGTFMMGSENGDDDEKPVHQVTVSGFHMDRTEVTNGQYDACVQAGKCLPAHYDDTLFVVRNKKKWKKGIIGQEFRGPLQPVVAVTWEQANTYCRWRGGRLPTETEWEYACRAGQATNCSWDYDSDNGYAWYGENSNNRTHPVAQKKPDNCGLYDMRGNVWEWCSDWYGASYYRESPSQNPQGPESGDRRVLRGGSWIIDRNHLRCSYRYRHEPDFRNNLLGFRCVR
ncbi:MAG: formylglycine-generating enzyme family protein [Chitinispirillaceae bacterium]|nr:formylglycine-generating enzyme family protein [Chitinispirillaceae bacterium]